MREKRHHTKRNSRTLSNFVQETNQGIGQLGDASPPADAGSLSTACVSTFPVTPDCKHPPVETKCKEGFCEIPPGCFVMGSPACQAGRGSASEPESQVTLTHRFEIAQHETTQEEWMAAGFPNNAVPAKNEPDSYGS